MVSLYQRLKVKLGFFMAKLTKLQFSNLWQFFRNMQDSDEITDFDIDAVKNTANFTVPINFFS